ncbi:MAG: DUF368 domain-containing protein [Planctomycetaceae bacterium]|nr:DUF368 domain-containing protein [Planctomycetaceae bacterium]
MDDASTGTTGVPQESSWRADLRTAGCGFLMGAADIVPGVSGGTVAFILGIYDRLIDAISNVDSHFIGLLLRRRVREAIAYLDLRFLIALLLGIVTGIGALASLMRHLLMHERTPTYAAFAGLILASIVLVARRVRRWNMQAVGVAVLGAVVALRLVTLDSIQSPPEGLWYVGVCGMIGICAMILPGISGAFILVLLRRYFYVVDRLKSLMHGEVTVDNLLPVIVFAGGCLAGILTFSRVLRWLLHHYHDLTVAALTGFMIGAMHCLWPFQQDSTPQEVNFNRKVFVHVMPEQWTAFLVPLLICIVAATFVLALDHFAHRQRKLLTIAEGSEI